MVYDVPSLSADGLAGSSDGRQHGKTDRRSIGERLELYLLMAAAFFAPMNFLRLDVFYFTFGDLCAVAALFVVLVRSTLPLRFAGLTTPIWVTGAMVLIGGLFVSSVVYGDVGRGAIVSGQYFFAYLIVPMLIVSRPWHQLVPIILAFIASIALMCLFGVYLIHIDGQTNTRFVSGSGRLQSFVERENECAALIALTIPLVLWLAHCGRLNRILELALLALFIYGVMLTGSNSGLFASVYAITIFHFLTISWRKTMLAVTMVSGVIAAAGTWGESFLPPVFQRRVLAALETGDIDRAGTFADRAALIRESFGFAEHTMLLGLGADRYREVSAWGAPVHNAYMLLWTEGGLISALGLIALIVAAVCPAVLVFRQPEGRGYAAATFSVATVFAGVLIAVPHVYGRFWVMPLVLGMAICIAFLAHGPLPARRGDDGPAPRRLGT